MSTQITTAFVEQYKSNVIATFQQKMSKLRTTVRNDTLTGKTGYYEFVGAVDMVDAVTRHDVTPQVDTPHSRRQVTAVTSRYADKIDQRDKVRTLIDISSSYVQAAGASVGRKFDDVIIAALGGNSYSGVAGATVAALPSAQKIAASSASLTVAKLITAKEILGVADVDMEALTCVITPAGLSALLGQTSVTSADYNSVKALVAGQVDTFMGFKFIVSSRLHVSNTAAGAKYAYVYARDAVVLATATEPTVRIDELPTHNYSTQVFVEMDCGATRLQDAGVVQIAYV